MIRKNTSLMFIALLCIVVINVAPIHTKSVIVKASNLKEEYYKGEDLILYVSILNNKSGGGVLTIEKLNISIWRVEKRYDRWRNIEMVYNKSREIGETIEANQVYSIRIQIQLNFTPARYNLTVAIYTDETSEPYYAVKGYLFWIRSAVRIPPIVWAIIVDVLFILAAMIIYRKLR